MRRIRGLVATAAIVLAALATAAWWRSGTRLTAPSPAVLATGNAARSRAPTRGARGQAAPGLVAVRGRVTAKDGPPIPGAEVRIVRFERHTDILAEVETGDDGAFEAFVPPGEFVALATAQGFAGAEETNGYAPGEPLTIAMDRGAVLVGRVVRADTGEPVPGATVEDGRREERAQTDAAGRFRIEGLYGRRYKPIARAPGLFGQAPESVLVAGGETSAEITIAVRPAATLQGRLELASTGAPCPGGRVTLRSGVTGPVDAIAAEAIADEVGGVLFDALLPGPYEARLSCAGHATDQKAPPVEVRDAPLSVMFAVRDQLAIVGLVVDEAGTPVCDVHVDVEHTGPGKWSFDVATSGADGRFEVRGVEAGTYEIDAAMVGEWGHPKRGPQTVTLPAVGAAPEVRVVVERRYRLAGRVVDEQGRPVPWVDVHDARSDDDGVTMNLPGDGHFELGGLPPGEVPLRVEQLGRELRVLSPKEVMSVPNDRPVTLIVTAPPVGRIEGRVLGGASAGERPWVEVYSSRRYFFDRVRTDKDGRFSTTVPPGIECVVSAQTSGGETAEVSHVFAGAEVELSLLPPATLRGTVHGAPPAFQVRLLPPVFRDELFFANDGAWEMRGVPAGTTTVQVGAAGRVVAEDVTLAPGEVRTIDLQLLPPGGDHAGGGGEP